MRVPSLLLIAAGGLALSACAGRNTPPSRSVTVVYTDARMIERAFTDDGLLLERYDVNNDGVIDNYVYLQPMDDYDMDLQDLTGLMPYEIENVRVVRKEIDVNFDGTIDVIRFYNRRGVPFREELDTNFDGNVDRRNYYDGDRLVRREIDTNGDGTFDERRHYAEGELFRVERDTTGDGQSDTWQFYERTQLVRVGRDLDGDGVIDAWQQIRIDRDRPDVMGTRDRNQETNGD